MCTFFFNVQSSFRARPSFFFSNTLQSADRQTRELLFRRKGTRGVSFRVGHFVVETARGCEFQRKRDQCGGNCPCYGEDKELHPSLCFAFFLPCGGKSTSNKVVEMQQFELCRIVLLV